MLLFFNKLVPLKPFPPSKTVYINYRFLGTSTRVHLVQRPEALVKLRTGVRFPLLSLAAVAREGPCSRRHPVLQPPSPCPGARAWRRLSSAGVPRPLTDPGRPAEQEGSLLLPGGSRFVINVNTVATLGALTSVWSSSA